MLHNDDRTAPGMWMKKENTVFCFLPGMKYLVEMDHSKWWKNTSAIHHSQNYFDASQGESLVAERLKTGKTVFDFFLKLAYLPAMESSGCQQEEKTKLF
jgi:nicotinamide-nucleotide amidase